MYVDRVGILAAHPELLEGQEGMVKHALAAASAVAIATVAVAVTEPASEQGGLGATQPSDAAPSAVAAASGVLRPLLARHSAALLSLLAAVLLVVLSILAGWLLLWHTTLRHIGVFRDIMGLNKKQKQADTQLGNDGSGSGSALVPSKSSLLAAEIERVKRQHSRSSYQRSHSLTK